MWKFPYNVNCKYGYDDSYDIEISSKYQNFSPDLKNGHKYWCCSLIEIIPFLPFQHFPPR